MPLFAHRRDAWNVYRWIQSVFSILAEPLSRTAGRWQRRCFPRSFSETTFQNAVISRQIFHNSVTRKIKNEIGSRGNKTTRVLYCHWRAILHAPLWPLTCLSNFLLRCLRFSRTKKRCNYPRNAHQRDGLSEVGRHRRHLHRPLFGCHHIYSRFTTGHGIPGVQVYIIFYIQYILTLCCPYVSSCADRGQLISRFWPSYRSWSSGSLQFCGTARCRP